jgi:hypothetical protein
MSGRAYYMTTYAAWREFCPCFSGSHWVAADPAVEGSEFVDTTAILALIEADEATHARLEQHAQFAALPHAIASTPVSDEISASLAGHGVGPGASTFHVAEALGRVHPLLRYRVF